MSVDSTDEREQERIIRAQIAAVFTPLFLAVGDAARLDDQDALDRATAAACAHIHAYAKSIWNEAFEKGAGRGLEAGADTALTVLLDNGLIGGINI